MKILVLGNGFDLAHSLPTRYADFLDFCRTAMSIADNNMQFFGVMQSVFGHSYHLRSDGTPNESCLNNCREVAALIFGNRWFEYLYELYELKKLSGENWIDFESEISYIIYHLDCIGYDLNDRVVPKIETNIEECFENPALKVTKEDFFWIIFRCLVDDYEQCTFKTLRKILLKDLKGLIKALNIYCTSFIEEYLEKSPSEVQKVSLFDRIFPSHVVSFNYTHTYQKMYPDKRPCETFYPHGECKGEKDSGVCDLVLGIDEYWVDDRKNTHTNYSVFKKYVQRIQNETYRDINALFGSIDEYRLTVDTSTPGEPNAYVDLSKAVELCFFGHSLDITDKDILYKLFSIQEVDCTIYCKDEETQGEYIANVVKIIGQEELLQRMEHGKISFCVLGNGDV